MLIFFIIAPAMFAKMDTLQEALQFNPITLYIPDCAPQEEFRKTTQNLQYWIEIILADSCDVEQDIQTLGNIRDNIQNQKLFTVNLIAIKQSEFKIQGLMHITHSVCENNDQLSITGQTLVDQILFQLQKMIDSLKEVLAIKNKSSTINSLNQQIVEVETYKEFCQKKEQRKREAQQEVQTRESQSIKASAGYTEEQCEEQFGNSGSQTSKTKEQSSTNNDGSQAILQPASNQIENRDPQQQEQASQEAQADQSSQNSRSNGSASEESNQNTNNPSIQQAVNENQSSTTIQNDQLSSNSSSTVVESENQQNSTIVQGQQEVGIIRDEQNTSEQGSQHTSNDNKNQSAQSQKQQFQSDDCEQPRQPQSSVNITINNDNSSNAYFDQLVNAIKQAQLQNVTMNVTIYEYKNVTTINDGTEAITQLIGALAEQPACQSQPVVVVVEEDDTPDNKTKPSITDKIEEVDEDDEEEEEEDIARMGFTTNKTDTPTTVPSEEVVETEEDEEVEDIYRLTEEGEQEELERTEETIVVNITSDSEIVFPEDYQEQTEEVEEIVSEEIISEEKDSDSNKTEQFEIVFPEESFLEEVAEDFQEEELIENDDPKVRNATEESKVEYLEYDEEGESEDHFEEDVTVKNITKESDFVFPDEDEEEVSDESVDSSIKPIKANSTEASQSCKYQQCQIDEWKGYIKQRQADGVEIDESTYTIDMWWWEFYGSKTAAAAGATSSKVASYSSRNYTDVDTQAWKQEVAKKQAQGFEIDEETYTIDMWWWEFHGSKAATAEGTKSSIATSNSSSIIYTEADAEAWRQEMAKKQSQGFEVDEQTYTIDMWWWEFYGSRQVSASQNLTSTTDMSSNRQYSEADIKAWRAELMKKQSLGYQIDEGSYTIDMWWWEYFGSQQLTTGSASIQRIYSEADISSWKLEIARKQKLGYQIDESTYTIDMWWWEFKGSQYKSSSHTVEEGEYYEYYENGEEVIEVHYNSSSADSYEIVFPEDEEEWLWLQGGELMEWNEVDRVKKTQVEKIYSGKVRDKNGNEHIVRKVIHKQLAKGREIPTDYHIANINLRNQRRNNAKGEKKPSQKQGLLERIFSVFTHN